jgi:hypothetical protein
MPIRTDVVTRLTAVAVTAAGLATAGCAGDGSVSTAVQLRAPVTVRVAAASPARLTVAQARAAYSEISAPAMAAAGSLPGAAGVFSSDSACRDSTENADTIRRILTCRRRSADRP